MTKKELGTVDDQNVTGPDAYDTRVWVAVEPGAAPGAPLTGHLFAFGGLLRRCLFVHFATSVASDRDEPVLSARLATARTRIVGAITLDAQRVTDAARPPEMPAPGPAR